MVMEVSANGESRECISIGDYIVIQRNSYFRLHQLSDGSIVLGKDKVELKPVIGRPYWTTFKMFPKVGHKREFNLEPCNRVESLTESLMKDVTSGRDNRDITDDGRSQLLSTEEIIELRDSGVSPQNILGKLIENSKTFKNKTEYSQEKYVKKKEKKYCEYLTIRKPTVRLLAEIFYNRDQTKVMGLRYDTLSQIVTACNIQSNGSYILFENGTQALVGAAILNQLGTGGVLINLTLGNQVQKQAVLAMNFEKQRLDSFLCVKATSLISSIYPDQTGISSTTENKIDANVCDKKGTNNSDIDDINRKRKATSPETIVIKKPKWAEELEKACSIIQSNKIDGMVIASKEYSFNLISKLIPFIKPSRPLVIYSLYREPLVQYYIELKKRKDIIALHLTETWLRTYQILPDRTHPDVTMSASGGHLLTGIIIQL